MRALLLILQAVQAPIQITGTAEPDRVAVGEELVITIQAVTTLAGPIQVELPDPGGLELVERSERLEQTGRAGGPRTYVLELRLRARQVGAWRYAPLLLFVGGQSELGPELTVTVTGSGDPTGSTGVNPRVVSLVQRAPPPRPISGATVAVVASSGRVYRGQQLDVLTTAWFPRSIRSRLRRAPTLKPPVLDGVWAVPQRAVPGIVSSRTIGGDTYDLFVSHQVVFPLAPGKLVIPPARVEYAIPVSRRASAGERPVEAASATVTVDVAELPAAGRPPNFRGPVAGDLTIAYRIEHLPARAGDPLPVVVDLSGVGNIAFWPPPVVEWPAGARAYLDGVDDRQREPAGGLGGTRSFRFLVLPDSAGSLALPALGYDYFDPGQARYREAASAGVVVPVLEADPSAIRREPVPLATPSRDWPRVVAELDPARSPWWWAIALAPVIPAAVLVLRRKLGRRTRRAAGFSPIPALERAIRTLAPDVEPARPEAVTAGLRRAGVNRELAADMAQVRQRVDEARFAPGVERATPVGAAAGVLRRLPASLRRRVGLVLVLALAAGAARALQTTTPAALYDDGAYGPAAREFEREAKADPLSWQRWYDLAAAEYLAGRDAPAAAALTRSLELAPRAGLPRALWETLEREHEPLLQAARRMPFSRSEGWAAVLVLWLAGCLLLLTRTGPPWVARLPFGLALSAGVLTATVIATEREPAAYLGSAVPLRVSPHGLAPEHGGLPALARVVVEVATPSWVLVHDHLGNRGWVPASVPARVRM